MNLKRITRLLKLLQTLQAGNGQNADGLAMACDVSRRTMFRDLETLKEAGVPLQFDRLQDRYFIPSTFFLPPTNFTAAETLSLIALAGSLGKANQLPFYEPARSAALKLESSLPGALRSEIRSMTHSIQIRLGQINPLVGKDQHYQTLVDAMLARHVVRMVYESLTEWETITTNLRPYRLFFCQRSWYVIGRSSLHAEVRTFNLGRIAQLEVLSQKYSQPRGFQLERYLGNAWQMIPDAGRDHNVQIRFQSFVARNVAEVLWHKTQQTTFEEDGSLDFRVRVSGLSEIAWWILGYGDQAEVLKPLKLRRLIAHRASNMHAIYNGKSEKGA